MWEYFSVSIRNHTPCAFMSYVHTRIFSLSVEGHSFLGPSYLCKTAVPYNCILQEREVFSFFVIVGKIANQTRIHSCIWEVDQVINIICGGHFIVLKMDSFTKRINKVNFSQKIMQL